ncbi:MAG TPA: glycosyltransferase family 39 protein [Verrucomicrobiae bacterium]|nr:glycosyltransferase family 39 protein [Verrucomicrobiae bacterium]
MPSQTPTDLAKSPSIHRTAVQRSSHKGVLHRLDLFSGVAAAGVAVAAAMHAVVAYATLRRPYDTDYHSWASALYSVIARSFTEQGIVALHGLPIANNPPIGTQPDAYIHWPPLFSIVLSRLFLLFGESEAVARAFAFTISCACVVMVFLLARACRGTRVALGAILGFLTLPAFFVFTRLVQGTMLSIFFEMLGLFCFVKTKGNSRCAWWPAAGVIALVLAVWSSWEPLLLAPTLLVIALLQRERVPLAITYLATGAVAFGIVVILYVAGAPKMAFDLWQTLIYRVGFNYANDSQALPLHALPNLFFYTAHNSWPDTARIYFHDVREVLGTGGEIMLLCVGVTLSVRRTSADREMLLVLGGLLGPWVLWFLLMHNQVLDNSFEWLLATPAAALCVGVMFVTVHDAVRDKLPGGALPVRIVVTVGFALYLLWPLARDVSSEWPAPQPTGWVKYALDIHQNTPQDAVVLTPSPSLLPVYYARRHLLRANRDDRAVNLTLRNLDAVFPGSSVFIALPPQDSPQALNNWRESLRHFPLAKETPYLILLYVGNAGDGRMAAAARLLSADDFGNPGEQ